MRRSGLRRLAAIVAAAAAIATGAVTIGAGPADAASATTPATLVSHVSHTMRPADWHWP